MLIVFACVLLTSPSILLYFNYPHITKQRIHDYARFHRAGTVPVRLLLFYVCVVASGPNTQTLTAVLALGSKVCRLKICITPFDRVPYTLTLLQFSTVSRFMNVNRRQFTDVQAGDRDHGCGEWTPGYVIASDGDHNGQITWCDSFGSKHRQCITLGNKIH
jgi:hypothetical protein